MIQSKDIQTTASACSSSSWLSASGPLTIPMTNDYLFRALLQRNNHVLKGLICSLLNLSSSNVKSVIINNPIILGESINDKTFLLDISLTLNNKALINLEMQVINEHNWPERSLSYLCRTFDNLNSGESYQSVKPAIQISLLDFTLFPSHPEFYSTYQFLNVKNHTLYSDKLRLSVLNLTRIDLATAEDIACGLDHWASLFKASTWEELKMLAKQDDFINEASATIYQLSQEETIQLQCQAREDYYRRQRSIQSMLKEQDEKIESYENTIKDYSNTIKARDNTITQMTNEITALQNQLTSALEQIASLQGSDNNLIE